MRRERKVIVGGGAAGFFAAIACARASPSSKVLLLEKSAHYLAKVRISGGGRCNVTHACFDPKALASSYPRGGRALIGPLHRFGPRDTVEWFQNRGVPLKTEKDGRIFPTTDSSETIFDCLVSEAAGSGVEVRTNCGLKSVRLRPSAGFDLELGNGERLRCDRLLLATGGCRTPAGGALAISLGQTLELPVPSLFTFRVDTPWLRQLPGLSVESAEVSVPGTGLKERGPLLVTHSGLSGPAILRLSAFGARILHSRNYRFPLHINWLPELNQREICLKLDSRRSNHPIQRVRNRPIAPLPARLWEQLCRAAHIAPDVQWTRLPRDCRSALLAALTQTEFAVIGKSTNKEEFVTCGGIRLNEVDFKTMESRICPGLYFAGELLDIDGITGGFNFQAAWTTGWIAGHAMAEAP